MTTESPRAAVLSDEFRGDDAHLVDCINALVAISDRGSLSDGPLGGHARTLLVIAASRLAAADSARAVDAGSEPLTAEAVVQWIRNNYQDYLSVGSLTDALREHFAARSVPAADAPAWSTEAGRRAMFLIDPTAPAAAGAAPQAPIHDAIEAARAEVASWEPWMREATKVRTLTMPGAAPQAMPADCKHQRRCADQEHNWCPDCGTDLPHPMLDEAVTRGQTIKRLQDALHDANEELRTLRAKVSALARPAAGAGEPQPNAWQREGVTLTARQLAEAILLATGDTVTFSDPDMADTEVTIAHAPEGFCRDDDNKPQPAGLVAWLTDYPEEGCTPLPDPLADQAREAFAALSTRTAQGGQE